MRIVTCVRRALDWNLSTKDFRIDAGTQQPVVSFARYRLDQFDEIAVEVALQARGRTPDIEVHALSIDARSGEDSLKQAIGMGASGATLVECAVPADHPVPALLAAAVLEMEYVEIVLCGRVGSERGSAVTAPLIAELLGRPLVTNIVRMEKHEQGWVCQREAEHGYERVLVRGAFVASVTNASFNVPRVPTLKDKMHAHRQVVAIVPASSLASRPAYRPTAVVQPRILRRFVPQVARQGVRLAGDIGYQAQALADYIVNAVRTAQ